MENLVTIVTDSAERHPGGTLPFSRKLELSYSRQIVISGKALAGVCCLKASTAGICKLHGLILYGDVYTYS